MLARYEFLRQLIKRSRERKTQITFCLIPSERHSWPGLMHNIERSGWNCYNTYDEF